MENEQNDWDKIEELEEKKRELIEEKERLNIKRSKEKEIKELENEIKHLKNPYINTSKSFLKSTFNTLANIGDKVIGVVKQMDNPLPQRREHVSHDVVTEPKNIKKNIKKKKKKSKKSKKKVKKVKSHFQPQRPEPKAQQPDDVMKNIEKSINDIENNMSKYDI